MLAGEPLRGGVGGHRVAIGRVPASAAASPASEIRHAFSRLITYTKQLPAVQSNARRELLDIAQKARRASQDSPCRARSLMNGYEKLLEQLKRGIGARGMLETDAVAVDASLLSSAMAKKCGGADRPPSSELKTRLLSSDLNEIGRAH